MKVGENIIDLSIIIINYRTPKLTVRCIESIASISSLNFEIIVIDNHSEDNSIPFIRSKFQTINIIENNENEGFGRANNLGATIAKGQNLLFLNSDMLLKNGTIEYCVNYLKTNSQIGVMGCQLRNEDGSIQKSTYTNVGKLKSILFRSVLISYFFREGKSEIEGVMGAFFLIPAKVFHEVNGFDSDFFMYGEELELCRRISKKGYSIVSTTAVEAIHKHGGSSNGSDWGSKQNWLSTALLFYKINGLGGYFLYHFFQIAVFLMNFSVLWKMNRNYRKGFWEECYYYFSNAGYYLMIPFKYSKKQNSGKTFLLRK
jgi:GT2 family glycosyltransferase